MVRTRPTGDLPDLLKRYIRQETVEPFRSLGRFMGFGLLGAALITAGCLLLGTGGLRLLQQWDALGGRWSWAPYLVVAVVMVAMAVMAASRIGGRVVREEDQ